VSVVEGRLFDGRSSAGQPVRLSARAGALVIQGEGAERTLARREIVVSERLASAPRLIHLADGGQIEVRDHAGLDAVLGALGVNDGLVVRWQRHWPAAVVALLVTIAVVWGSYAWLLPKAAHWVAQRVPMAVEEAIGREAVGIVDRRFFGPSELPVERQQALRARFAALADAQPGRVLRVEFRKSKIGPNAVALPGGLVIVTDELVALAPSDDAIVAVMAHELGHVEQRHFLRRVVSSTITGAAMTLIAGDAGGMVTAVPAALADLAYSRDMEREADRYAVDLLKQRGIPPLALAQMLEALERDRARAEGKGSGKDTDGRNGDGKASARGKARTGLPDYMATHPATAERIEAIHQAR
jgi:Zn-dependent protease with chaperone function